MWNAPLTNGTTLSVAIGCALFLFGLSIGLVIAGICWVFIAASGDYQANPSQESYASISDDEIEIVIELVRDAVAACGWTLCGDCYTRQLLQQLPLPNPVDRGLQDSCRFLFPIPILEDCKTVGNCKEAEYLNAAYMQGCDELARHYGTARIAHPVVEDCKAMASRNSLIQRANPSGRGLQGTNEAAGRASGVYGESCSPLSLQ